MQTVVSERKMAMVEVAAESYRMQFRRYALALLLADALALALAFWLAYTVRFNWQLKIFQLDVPGRSSFYLPLSAGLIVAWLLLFGAYRLYDEQVLLGGVREYVQLFNACISGAILIAIAQFFVLELSVARGWVGLAWAFSFLVVGLERFLMRRVGYALRRGGHLTRSALILGASAEGVLLGEQFLAWPTSGLRVVGYVDERLPLQSAICPGLPVLGRFADLDELMKRYAVTELVLTTSALTREQILELFKRFGTASDVRLRMSSGLFDLLTTGLEVKEMGYVPLISVNRVRLQPAEAAFKRFCDIVLALLALTLGSPIFLAIALVVRFTSPGPVLYRRRVMGLNGTQFDAFKFRTMYVNGDEMLRNNPAAMEELATTHKIKNDPRITRVGCWLRKFSLDELPQFINILIGQMSLVGPRMISPPELEKYGQWGMNLLTVRPGLTGLWQVSGRSDVSYEERVRLDMLYIRNYNIWLDVQIVLRTIPVLLFGRGAY